MKFKKMNPTLIIAIGGIIILLGTGISIYGAYRQGIESSEQTNRIEDTLVRETYKLSNPLPSEFYGTNLIVIIKPEALLEYLPELRKKFKTDSLLSEHYGKGKNLNTNFPLKHGEINPNLIGLFEGRKLSIILQMNEEDHPWKNLTARKLVWKFETKISLKDKNTHLLYFIDYENDVKEYFRLSLGNSEKLQQSTSLTINSLSSALELCDAKVWISLNIEDNQKLTEPSASVTSINLRDNNSKDYFVEFNGFKIIRESNTNFKKKSPNLNVPDYFETTFSIGSLKCSSIKTFN